MHRYVLTSSSSLCERARYIEVEGSETQWKQKHDGSKDNHSDRNLVVRRHHNDRMSTDVEPAFLGNTILGFFLHCQIVLDRLYAGNLPDGPGRIGTGHDVFDLAGQRDDPCISLNSNACCLQVHSPSPCVPSRVS